MSEFLAFSYTFMSDFTVFCTFMSEFEMNRPRLINTICQTLQAFNRCTSQCKEAAPRGGLLRFVVLLEIHIVFSDTHARGPVLWNAPIDNREDGMPCPTQPPSTPTNSDASWPAGPTPRRRTASFARRNLDTSQTVGHAPNAHHRNSLAAYLRLQWSHTLAHNAEQP